MLAFSVLVAGSLLSTDAIAHELSQDADPIRGTWTASTVVKGKKAGTALHLVLSRRSEKGNWQNGDYVPFDELADLDRGALNSSAPTTAQFSLVREAGTFAFNGTFAEGEGGGTFRFSPSQAFADEMKRWGYSRLSDDEHYSMATLNVTTGFVKGLAEAGYDDLDKDDLFAFAVHDVDAAFVQSFAAIGFDDLPADKLVAMSIHDVTPEFAGAMKEYGLRGLTAGKLISMSIHDVTPDFVSGLESRGYSSVGTDKLIAMKIHDVSLEMIDDLAEAGYENVPVDKLIQLQIHDVAPSDVRRMRKAVSDS